MHRAACCRLRGLPHVQLATAAWLSNGRGLAGKCTQTPLSSGAAFPRGDESPHVHTRREATTAFHSCVGRPPHNCLRSWLSPLAGKVCLSLERQGREPGLHGGLAPRAVPARSSASGCAGRRGSCEARETPDPGLHPGPAAGAQGATAGRTGKSISGRAPPTTGALLSLPLPTNQPPTLVGGALTASDALSRDSPGLSPFLTWKRMEGPETLVSTVHTMNHEPKRMHPLLWEKQCQRGWDGRGLGAAPQRTTEHLDFLSSKTGTQTVPPLGAAGRVNGPFL